MVSSILDIQKNSTFLKSLLHEGKQEELWKALQDTPLPDVAEFLAEQPPSILKDLFLLFDQEKQASLFDYFHINKQIEVYNALPIRVFSGIFQKMHSDTRADFYLELLEEQRMKLLPYLPKAVRRDVLTLSGYPEDKAGGIMSTDFVMVYGNMTVEEALAKIRQEAPSKKLMYCLYVVDENIHLTGIVDLKDLIMSDPKTSINALKNDNIICANLYDDKESVAHKIEKYDLMAIPILNGDGQVVGIVSYDDAIDVIRDEQTEDMERFMGIIPIGHRNDYLHTSSVQHFKQRMGWVAGLFFLGTFVVMIMHRYEKMFQSLPFLAFYLPLMSDTGGNVGSQSATMVIRSLALGEVTLKNWIKIVYKEAKVACMLALMLFFLCFIKVSAVDWISKWYCNQSANWDEICKIALTVSIAITLQVISATLLGATLPLLIKRLGKDPALAASPAITTIADLSGILIYLHIASFIFSEFF